MAKKVTKKATTKRTSKKDNGEALKKAQERIQSERDSYQAERDMSTFEEKHMGQPKKPQDERSFPSLVSLMDSGVQKEIDHETKVWNERLFTDSPYKGTELDRFPLSPSQIGKCALALGRNLSHYLGIFSYPRAADALAPRTKRIFNRGHLLEDALIQDFAKYTDLKVVRRQRRVRLPFALGGGKRHIEGSIDVEFEAPDGTSILTDMKSKGAYYSAAFNDSISETFQGYRETGLVSEFAPNSFLISDALAFFNVISLDDFFVDYLLQLNSYGFSIDVETGEQLHFDFCSLYYENKNSCQNYELRWKPHPGLMQFAQEKFEYIYNNVRLAAGEHKATNGEVPFEVILMDKIPKEFSLGTARCKLCDHKELCYGVFDPATKPATHKMGALDPELDKKLVGSISQEQLTDRIKQDVLQAMAQQDATHIETSNGICYERKWYKTEKSYKLKQVRKPL